MNPFSAAHFRKSFGEAEISLGGSMASLDSGNREHHFIAQKFFTKIVEILNGDFFFLDTNQLFWSHVIDNIKIPIYQIMNALEF